MGQRRAWDDLEYLTRDRLRNEMRFSQMAIELHRQMKAHAPEMHELGTIVGEPQIIAGEKIKLYGIGPSYTRMPNGDLAYAYYDPLFNRITVPEGGKFLKGKLNWLAWHELGHWLLFWYHPEDKYRHDPKNHWTEWSFLFDKTWSD